MSRQIIKIIFFLSLLYLQNVLGSNLDGTSTVVYKNEHHVFSNGESARGYVRMNGGFTVKPGAVATLDTVISVSGPIDLRDSGVLQLLKDLEFDAGVTLSSGGYINGREKALILNNKLSIPSSKVIHISGDTLIEGKGNTIFFDEHAQIFVDSNVTLTLRNVVICNTKNSLTNPCLRVSGNGGKLAFDNVVLAMANDINFDSGQLYIHNDVAFTGTSAFIYHSTAASFIAPSSTLLFDFGTTFSFAPTTTTDHLFQLQDRTSTLCLNGCTLSATSSGIRLTRGSLQFENKVILNSKTDVLFSTLSTVTSADYGLTASAATINSTVWSPDGKTIALGGLNPALFGGALNTNELQIYGFDGSILTPLASEDYGVGIYSVAWNPDGKTLAIGGSNPGMVGGFANTHSLRLYGVDGATLTPLTSFNYGGGASNSIEAIAWSPDGKTLAFGGTTNIISGFPPDNTTAVELHSFNGSTLTALTSQNYGVSITAISWSPDGKTLALAGNKAQSTGGFHNSEHLRLYSFDGTMLNTLTGTSYASGSGNQIRAIAWSPDGKTLAIGGSNPEATGGFANTDELRLYSFNGSTLNALTSQNYNSGITNYIKSIAWSPDGKILAVGGFNPGVTGGFTTFDDLRLYSFDGQTLTPVVGERYGGTIQSIAWSPDGRVLVMGGFNPTHFGGVTNHDELQLYSASSFSNNSSPQAFSRSIVFGNSNLGSDYNLNVEVLGAAHVMVNGIVNDDSV